MAQLMDTTKPKQVVCITGTVWTGKRSAPRRLLVKDGFVRPTWVTTGRRLTDAPYRHISETRFHLAQADKSLLAYFRYAGSLAGILKEDFDSALASSQCGVLVVGPPEVAAQIASAVPAAIVFALKGERMDLSRHLDSASSRGQLRRIDVDVLEPDAWTKVHVSMVEALGLPLLSDPF